MASDYDIKEFHLFAGIGGGIYGGLILGHICCGGVEIDAYATNVLKQRQRDGWLAPFDIYPDVTKLNGKQFKGTFDVLCGGFPCQAFSTAAHGKNIADKNLWKYMFKFIKESDAPVVFGENVVLRAIMQAKKDLEQIGYKVSTCRLSCNDLGADHKRNRFWFLAVKDDKSFNRVASHIQKLPKITGRIWSKSPQETEYPSQVKVKRNQLRGIGNAQSPLVCATAFRILVNRMNNKDFTSILVTDKELNEVFSKEETWVHREFGDIGGIHTPTTMANYHCASMMKHKSCQNFVKVFGKPAPINGEFLMGMPIGASSPEPISKKTLEEWKNLIF